jgi:hypothetical protein
MHAVAHTQGPVQGILMYCAQYSYSNKVAGVTVELCCCSNPRSSGFNWRLYYVRLTDGVF